MTYILSFIVAFGVGAIVGQILIPLLHRLKAGQAIREDGPTWHMAKQGTPTMGGLMFILAIAVAVFTAGASNSTRRTRVVTRPGGNSNGELFHQVGCRSCIGARFLAGFPGGQG